MSIQSSLSCETGCMALSALTGAKVRCFHQVLYQHEPEDASGNRVTSTDGSTASTGGRKKFLQPTQAMLYVVMTDSELILLDLPAMATNYLSFLYRPLVFQNGRTTSEKQIAMSTAAVLLSAPPSAVSNEMRENLMEALALDDEADDDSGDDNDTSRQLDSKEAAAKLNPEYQALLESGKKQRAAQKSLTVSTTTEDGKPIRHPCKFQLAAVSYADVSSIVVYSEQETLFGLHLSKDPLEPSDVVQFTSVYRKQFIEDLQVCVNTFRLVSQNRLEPLPMRFKNDSAAKRGLHLAHPAVQFYDRLHPDKRDERALLYRCGYLFQLPRNAIDEYELMHNRPVSTYVYYDHKDQKAMKKASSAGSSRKHLVARFLPPQTISSFPLLSGAVVDSSIGSHAMNDSVGGAPPTTATHHNRNFTTDISDLQFRMWVDSVANTVAGRELEMGAGDSKDEKKDVVMESGVYRKKSNVVDDRASWTCYSVRIFTKYREIGVMGVRRKYIPPYIDSYQDMVFVLYSAQNTTNFTYSKTFMMELEDLVDSLGPAVSPQPFAKSPLHVGSGTLSDSLEMAIHATQPHHTYYDRLTIQARANTLLFSHSMYAWLHNRLDLGIVPQTKFLDMECWKLARIFCRSVAKSAGLTVDDLKLKKDAAEQKEKRAANAGDDDADDDDKDEKDQQAKDESKEKADKGPKTVEAVENPMALVFRMMAELAVDESAILDEKSGASGHIDARKLAIREARRVGIARLREDWRCRIARYFAFCMDGGVYPGTLTLARLADEVGAERRISVENVALVDRVIDFLLHLRSTEIPPVAPPSAIAASGGLQLNAAPLTPALLGFYPFEQMDNVIIKLRQNGFLRKFTCDEDVMCRLLYTDYLETLERRNDPNRRLGSIFCDLLRALLEKDYNLQLIQAVCQKIQRVTVTGLYQTGMLVEPLIALLRRGNMYTQTYALQCLSLLSIHGEAPSIFKQGGVALAVGCVHGSHNDECLQAAMQLIARVVHQQPDAIHMCTHSEFSRRLVALLAVRYGGIRHHQPLIADTASVIIKLSAQPKPLAILLENYCHERLIEIIGEHEDYDAILVKITAALGTLFVNAAPGFEVQRGYMTQHGPKLIEVLKKCKSAEQMQIALNLLIAIRYMIRESNERRLDILQTLYSGFETVIKSLRPEINRLKNEKNANVGSDIYKIIMGVDVKLLWFEAQIQDAIKHKPGWEKQANAVAAAVASPKQ